MKSDMAKIICERPRYGSSSGWSDRRAYIRDMEVDELPRKISMRSLYDRRKELNENLTPLYRYLNRQVGRKWNDIYSEICEHVNTNSAVQLHILQHLLNDGVVELNAKVINGHLYDSEGVYLLNNWRHQNSYQQMFVDPRDGTLKLLPTRNKDKKPVRDDVIQSDDAMVDYWLLNGIWFEVSFCPASSPRTSEYSRLIVYNDILKKDRIDYWGLSNRYGSRLPVSKRQLGKKEIKRLNLWQRRMVLSKSH